jgi:hypothetical protein
MLITVLQKEELTGIDGAVTAATTAAATATENAEQVTADHSAE